MLIEFRVENHRSIRDEQVLTMEAGPVGDPADLRPRTVAGNSAAVLPVAALYGANASGKSNVLDALVYMRDVVTLSHGIWPPDSGIPRDPFAWGPTRDEPSFYEIVLHLDGVRYQYGFVTSDERFLEEWLYAWPDGGKQVWFERDGSDFRFGEGMAGENAVIERITRPNALFLSSAAQNRHGPTRPIYTWFEQSRSFNVRPKSLIDETARMSRSLMENWPIESKMARLLGDAANPASHRSKEDVNANSPLADRLRTLIIGADFGVVDFRVERSDPVVSTHRPLPHFNRPRFFLKHQDSQDEAWLPLAEESSGTRTLFRIALPLLEVLSSGGIFIIDELESSLHPALARFLVREFNDPERNPHCGQLIFTTHDTSLLGNLLSEPDLRRDQVWLTEKDKDGASVLYPLTDFIPREPENLERGYLQGRYGAIPFLGDLMISRG